MLTVDTSAHHQAAEEQSDQRRSEKDLEKHVNSRFQVQIKATVQDGTICEPYYQYYSRHCEAIEVNMEDMPVSLSPVSIITVY